MYWNIPLPLAPIHQVMASIGFLLTIASLTSGVWKFLQPNPLAQEIWIRTRTWWAMCLIFLGGLLLHPLLSMVTLAYLSFISLRELISLLPFEKQDRSALFAAYGAVPLIYGLIAWEKAPYLPLCLVLLLVGIPILLAVQGATKNFFQRTSMISTSVLLTVVGLSFLARLLYLPGGEHLPAGGKGLLLFLVCLTELNDVFQFLIGKSLGKTALIPKISPGKTWEGLLGGMVGSLITAYFLKPLSPFSTSELLGVALLISLAGFLGDITLSAIKRGLNLKDTGKSLPGHGGILDRVDSLIFTAPLFYYVVSLLTASS